MDWAECIRNLREKLLITQAELAVMVGVSYASINRYENNQYEPTIKVKRKLMELFKKNGIVEE
jgi:DNA-binding XRE family transcriptional regulator